MTNIQAFQILTDGTVKSATDFGVPASVRWFKLYVLQGSLSIGTIAQVTGETGMSLFANEDQANPTVFDAPPVPYKYDMTALAIYGDNGNVGHIVCGV